jgi:hypothetical protein
MRDEIRVGGSGPANFATMLRKYLLHLRKKILRAISALRSRGNPDGQGVSGALMSYTSGL